MKLLGQNAYANSWVVKDTVWDLKFVKTPGYGNDGLCDPSIKTLFVCKTLPKGELFKTFIHEILHAIEDEYEIEIKHKHIEQFEEGIAEFFLQNLTAFAKILEIE